MKKEKSIANEILTGVTIGIFAGLVICLYRYLMMICDTALNTYIFPFLHGGSPFRLLLWAAGLTALAYAVCRLIRLEPDARGGGIPHAIKETEGHSDSRWWSVLLAKITAAPLCGLAGLSLGKTGPAIELGAMTGKGVERLSRHLSEKGELSRAEQASGATARHAYSGAAAGLAALFNAPLAGMWFASEKLHKTEGMSVLTAPVSAITAALVSIFVFGYKPIVDCALPLKDWKLYACVAVLGLFMGVLGCLYAKSLEFTTEKLAALHLSDAVLWIIVFLVSGAVGYFLPEITGGGSNLLAVMTGGRALFGTLALLVLGKYLFSMLSSGSGLPGGTVFPLLAVGGCLGQLFGIVANQLFPALHISPVTFILPGMAGFFTSVIGAPITGIFLLCEFSCDYHNFPPLLVVCVLSHLVAKRLIH